MTPCNGSKRPIGYVVTQHFCLDCAPEGLRDYYEPMREGEDYGIPYSCDMCAAKMVPAAAALPGTEKASRDHGPLGSLHADRAEIRRLRALTEGDPSSIYWEAAQYREALRDIAEHPGYGALSMRQRAQDALRRVQESAVAASEPEAP